MTNLSPVGSKGATFSSHKNSFDSESVFSDSTTCTGANKKFILTKRKNSYVNYTIGPQKKIHQISKLESENNIFDCFEDQKLSLEDPLKDDLANILNKKFYVAGTQNKIMKFEDNENSANSIFDQSTTPSECQEFNIENFFDLEDCQP